MNEMDKKQIIEDLRKLNPYPESIFHEPTQEEYELMHIALKKYAMKPDAFFASFGRLVWNNCVNVLEDCFNNEEDEDE